MNAKEKELIAKLQKNLRKEEVEKRNLTSSFYDELRKTTRNIPITEHNSRNGYAAEVNESVKECKCGCQNSNLSADERWNKLGLDNKVRNVVVENVNKMFNEPVEPKCCCRDEKKVTTDNEITDFSIELYDVDDNPMYINRHVTGFSVSGSSMYYVKNTEQRGVVVKLMVEGKENSDALKTVMDAATYAVIPNLKMVVNDNGLRIPYQLAKNARVDSVEITRLLDGISIKLHITY